MDPNPSFMTAPLATEFAQKKMIPESMQSLLVICDPSFVIGDEEAQSEVARMAESDRA